MTRHDNLRVDTGRIRQYPRGRVWKIQTGPLAGMWAAALVGAMSDRADIAPDQPTALRNACDLLRRETNNQRLTAGPARLSLTNPDIRRVDDAPQRVLSAADHAALTNRLSKQGAHRA